MTDGLVPWDAMDRAARILLQMRHTRHIITRRFPYIGVAIMAAVTFGFLAARNVDRAVAAPCAVPGATGPGGSITGVVNTYYPGTANEPAGVANTSIQVGALSPAGAPAIAAGDLLLVVQMQDAAINATNNGNYGDNTLGDPATGSTDLNNAGKYEYVRATGPVAGNLVPVAGACLNG